HRGSVPECDPRARTQSGGRLPGDGGPPAPAQGANLVAAPVGRGGRGGSAARAGPATARVSVDPRNRLLARQGIRATGRTNLPGLSPLAGTAAAAAARHRPAAAASGGREGGQ